MKKLIISISLLIRTISSPASIINIPTNYPTIQQGINNANNGDTVLVQPGNYLENLNFNGKNIVVASLYISTNDTNYISTTVIISSNPSSLNKSVVTFENNETSDAKLIGFTIKNGAGNYRLIGFDHIYYGGGIYCFNASPTLSHLEIADNNAECGGGIFLYESNSLIENCSIYYNTCNSISSAAPNAGGGIAIWNCLNAVFRNNKLNNNDVAYAGGAFYSLNSTALMVNCLINSNHSSTMGAAFYADSWSHLNITNCTISDNHCDPGQGLVISSLMYCIDSVNVKIDNSILFNNQPAALICQFNYGRNTISVSHSDIEGGIDSIYTNNNGNNVDILWMNGNINLDPVFVNPGNFDFHIQANSPCINSGDTSGIVGIPILDLDNNYRFNGIIDMGCYEFQNLTAIHVPDSYSEEIMIYPNPASDYLFIEIKDPEKEFSGNVYLYNLESKLLTLTSFDNISNIIKLPVNNLSNGFYFIVFDDGKLPCVKKIIINH